jgi:hypothetical protein
MRRIICISQSTLTAKSCIQTQCDDDCHSALLHFSSGSPEYTHDSFMSKIQWRDSSIYSWHCWKWVVGCNIGMTRWCCSVCGRSTCWWQFHFYICNTWNFACMFEEWIYTLHYISLQGSSAESYWLGVTLDIPPFKCHISAASEHYSI